MRLPTFLRTAKEANVHAGVSLSADGFAVAKVRREADLPPVLEYCAVRTGAGMEDSGSLRKLVRSHGLDRTGCISTIDIGAYSLLQVEAPDVQPEELRSAIRWKIKDLIDFHVDDAVVDVFEAPGQKTAGRNKMMNVVVTRAVNVKQLAQRLTELDLHLEVIDIPELALRNLAALLPEDVGGVVLVYLGEDRGVITISRQQVLYLSRRIDIGISALPPNTAMHANEQELIEDWLDRIVIEVQRSLDFYDSHFTQPRVTGLVLCPVGRELPGAAEYLSTQLAIPARLLELGEIIDLSEPVDLEVQARCLLAVGAALRTEVRTL